MPVGTIDPNEYQRFELKSLPPDGFIMLRPLPYGMKLTRRDKAAKLVMRSEAPQRGARGRMSGAGDGMNEVKSELETANEWSTLFDFRYCIGDHNITDVNGEKLDFSNAMTLKTLHPRLGSEIEELIYALNEDEDEESLQDFLKRRDASSSEEMMQAKSALDSPEDHVS